MTTEVPKSIRVNLLGQTFGRLTVIGYHGRVKFGKSTATMWVCRCECGDERPYHGGNLQQGASTQCRLCATKASKNTTHGMSNTPIHTMWTRIAGDRARRWDSFETFMADMGEKPTGKYLCKRNYDRPHSPSNSFWSDSPCKPVGHQYRVNGVSKNISQWAEECGITRERMRQRFKTYTPEEAVHGVGALPEKVSTERHWTDFLPRNEVFVVSFDSPDDANRFAINLRNRVRVKCRQIDSVLMCKIEESNEQTK